MSLPKGRAPEDVQGYVHAHERALKGRGEIACMHTHTCTQSGAVVQSPGKNQRRRLRRSQDEGRSVRAAIEGGGVASSRKGAVSKVCLN